MSQTPKPPSSVFTLDSELAYLRLQDRIGYGFRDTAFLQRALTHPSSTAEEDKDNERLEFLGDSVVNLCVGQALYQRYPKWNEGQLTQVKSAVVSTTTLARAGEALGLRESGRLGKGLPANAPLPPSVYANLFEAVCAAIYLDGGLDAARKFILRVLDPELKAIAEDGQEANYKSTLQQRAQRIAGVTPHYKVISATGPDHGKIFEVSAVIGTKTYPTGTGRSKKEAEQAAARRALEVLAAEESLAPNPNGEKCESQNNGHIHIDTSISVRTTVAAINGQ